MQVSSFETEIKVIIVGNGRVGKTSLMNRFVQDAFTFAYTKTIGVEYLEKMVTFYIFDIAGQEEYNALTKSYYKGAGVAIVAFSTIERMSFDAVPSWVWMVREECGQIPLVLVQTKSDLMSQACVSVQESTNFALTEKLKLYRVCAKENVSVNYVFEQLCIDYVRRKRLVGGQLESTLRSIDDVGYQNGRDKAFKMKAAPQSCSHMDCHSSDRQKPNSRFLSKCTIMWWILCIRYNKSRSWKFYIFRAATFLTNPRVAYVF
jgi:Ras-related protein Rab-23